MAGQESSALQARHASFECVAGMGVEGGAELMGIEIVNGELTSAIGDVVGAEARRVLLNIQNGRGKVKARVLLYATGTQEGRSSDQQ